MNSVNAIAKMLIITGVLILISGLVLLLLSKFPSLSFRLPGNILIKRKNFVFYFPLGISILLSILLTLILRIFK